MKLRALPAKPVLERVTLRLSHQAGPGEAGLWRRRVSQALERVTLQPSLPPQAILVVRRLADPQPGALLAGGAGSQRRAWERATQARLAGYWRRAARPARETVPPSAEAVWFADAAEWLACLSWDLHQGLAAGRWWWHSWLRDERFSSVAGALVEWWAEAAPYLPQSLALLHQQHGTQLGALLARLNPEQVALLRRAVLAAYRLPPDQPAHIVIERLHPLLPEAAQRLVPPLPTATQSLVLLCLAIDHAPIALTRLNQPPATAPGNPSLPAQTEADVEPAAVETVWGETQPPLERGSAPALLSEKLRATGPEALGQNLPYFSPKAFIPAQLEDETRLPTPASEPVVAVRPEPVKMPASNHPTGLDGLSPKGDRSLSEAAQSQARLLVNHPTTIAETGLHTAAGGLWYLVNVLSDLDWLDDDALNGWHRLSFLAQVLLPEPLPDPVWVLLASLAGEQVTPEAVRRWLARALPLVTGYLAERLAQPETFTEAIRAPATLFLTRTHIDVVFALDQIRLDLRQAGLDRDPGWTPALARVVAFHYE